MYFIRVPDDVASCLRCRDLVTCRRRGREGRRLDLMNPGPLDREAIKRCLGRTPLQGFQMPGGSYHGRCRAFNWPAPAEAGRHA